MKKKLLLLTVALVCVITCSLVLAACNEEGDKVSCALATTPEHISSVQINCGNSTEAFLGTSAGRWETPKQIDKNKEYEILVSLEYAYEIGTLKMSINGTEMTLTPMVDGDAKIVLGNYACKYTPTADFTITFAGEAKKSTTTLTFNTINWQPCYDYYPDTETSTVQGDALKAKIKNEVSITLLVNDSVITPYNGMKLGAFENSLSSNSVITVNVNDKIEIKLHTDSSELEFNDYIVDFVYQDFGQGGASNLSTNKKDYSFIVESMQNYAAEITLSINIYPTESN